MIAILKPKSKEAELNETLKKAQELGYTPKVLRGVERTIVACIGDERGKASLQTALEAFPWIERVMPILEPYKLAALETHPARSRVRITPDLEIGGKKIVVMAGPCSVESEQQILETARGVKRAGASVLRGGAFKPRTSPYAFQGMEEGGLKLLAKAREATGLPVVTEIMDQHDLPLLEEYADILQVGARNTQNFSLLKRLGKARKPVLLKRGLMTTISEFLQAAEYILSEGNPHVILCERGIRTFETATRNTLDLNAIPVLRAKTHLPILVDPSHGTGHWPYVAPMSYAAVAAGADGLIIEVHPRPEEALSDGAQSLKLSKFADLMKHLKGFARAAGRSL